MIGERAALAEPGDHHALAPDRRNLCGEGGMTDDGDEGAVRKMGRGETTGECGGG